MEKEECPYCEKYTEFDDTDFYEQDEDYEVECQHCEKIFTVTVSYSKDFTVNKTECLNEGEHTFKQIAGYPEIHYRGKYRCTQCGLEKTVQEEVATKEEWDEYFKKD